MLTGVAMHNKLLVISLIILSILAVMILIICLHQTGHNDSDQGITAK